MDVYSVIGANILKDDLVKSGWVRLRANNGNDE